VAAVDDEIEVLAHGQHIGPQGELAYPPPDG
jgi:hypothetical protein